MSIKNSTTIKFLTGIWVTLILNLKGLTDLVVAFTTIKDFKIGNMDFTLGFEDLAILIMSLLLLWVMRAFKKMTAGINLSFAEMTENLNRSHRLNWTRTAYVYFYHENKSLSNSEYIKKLNHEGFSLEDLQEIGVTTEFINTNRDKLFPNIVMTKYQEFKKALSDFEGNKSTPNP